MSALREYRETIRYLSKKEVSQERTELFKILNGDAFFPLKIWPDEMKMVFWHKPIGDKETFKLALFLLGNGCSPYLISKWILLSQCWVPHKAEKRARQLDFVLNNADQKRSTWFYHDIDYKKLLYLNDLRKKWSEPAAYNVKKTKKNHKRKKKSLLNRRTKKGSFRSYQMYKNV